MILHLLGPHLNKVKVTRAVLCQAILYGVNSRAKDAATEERLLDLIMQGETSHCFLNIFYPTPQFSATYVTCRCVRRRSIVRPFLEHAPKPSEDIIHK